MLEYNKKDFMRIDLFNPYEFSLMSDAVHVVSESLKRSVELGCNRLVLTGARPMVKNIYLQALKEHEIDLEVGESLSSVLKKVGRKKT